jgi:phosphoglycolate phosphatase-like HAD superfamily hydrolase
MYKGILFDLDNTLLDYDRSELQSMYVALGRHGLDANGSRESCIFSKFWSCRSATPSPKSVRPVIARGALPSRIGSISAVYISRKKELRRR